MIYTFFLFLSPDLYVAIRLCFTNDLCHDVLPTCFSKAMGYAIHELKLLKLCGKINCPFLLIFSMVFVVWTDN